MPDFSQLTYRQREIYDYIHNTIESRGYGPTVREIGENFDIKSPNGVLCHLKALEMKGLVKRDPFSARAIHLNGPAAFPPKTQPAGQPVVLSVQVGCPNCQRVQEKYDKLEAELQVEKEYRRQVEEQKRCPDCQRGYEEWY
jgi:SOS-response transcriptional repressor LexA